MTMGGAQAVPIRRAPRLAGGAGNPGHASDPFALDVCGEGHSALLCAIDCSKSLNDRSGTNLRRLLEMRPEFQNLGPEGGQR